MNICDVMNDTLEKIKSIMDCKTVVGDAVVNNEFVRVIPISKMSVGLAGLGGEWEGKRPKPEKNLPFGGLGAGAQIDPIGFLVVNGERVRFLNVDGGEESWEHRVQNIVDFFTKS